MEPKPNEYGIDEMLLRCLNATATKEEYEQVYQWIQEPRHRQYFCEMLDVLVASHLLKPVNTEKQKQLWAKLEKIIRRKAQAKRITLIRWAASAADVLSLAYFGGIRTSGDSESPPPYTVEAGKNGNTILTLKEGTKVWLNKNSIITCGKNFGDKKREINLTGEAYLEVAKDDGKPFIVKTDKMEIEVLGTHFNVRAYSNEQTITATLMEGSIKVKKEEGSELPLLPGQQMKFDKTSKEITLHTVNSGLYAAWTTGWLVLDGEPADNVFTLIEQYYHVNIRLKTKSLDNWTVTGRFDLEDEPKQIFEVLKKTIPFEFQIENDTIYIN
jgi:ferric-dicitrate binding protein FerR (iron transport regulator)